MNTRFQISSQRGHVSLWSGTHSGPRRTAAPIEVDLASTARTARCRPSATSSSRRRWGSRPSGRAAPAAGRSRRARPRRRGRRSCTSWPPGARRGMPEVAGQEVPRPVDGLALEVVAEAPVAEHLEEGVVARRAPDLLEVVVLAGDAQAALVVDGAGVRALLGAGQHVLELDHPRVREEERLVAGRDEAGAGHDRMAALGEELDEPAADLGGGQRLDPRIGARDGGRHRPQW